MEQLQGGTEGLESNAGIGYEHINTRTRKMDEHALGYACARFLFSLDVSSQAKNSRAPWTGSDLLKSRYQTLICLWTVQYPLPFPAPCKANVSFGS